MSQRRWDERISGTGSFEDFERAVLDWTNYEVTPRNGQSVPEEAEPQRESGWGHGRGRAGHGWPDDCRGGHGDGKFDPVEGSRVQRLHRANRKMAMPGPSAEEDDLLLAGVVAPGEVDRRLGRTANTVPCPDGLPYYANKKAVLGGVGSDVHSLSG